MDLRQAITTLDVHLSDKSDHRRHAWDVVHAVVLEALKPSYNNARDEILAPNFDCTLICTNAKPCYQYCIDHNVDIDRGDERCKALGGLIRSPVA